VSTQAPVLTVIEPASGTRLRLVRRAKLLSWVSLVWMTIEGAVGVIAGLMAGSVALTGFGLDSVIEGAASVIVIWRFTGGRESSEAAEDRAQKLVGVSFFLLAPYIASDAILTLTSNAHPMTSWVGVALALGSIAFMPLLGRAKTALGAQLGSSATAGEGAQNMLCAYMAGGVLVGLLANALLEWWWLDPVIGLGIAALAVKEGREAWGGEVCADCAPIGFDGANANVRSCVDVEMPEPYDTTLRPSGR
jgi:divalent metal cation (Fe/Co/Zn/Cd) transporter